MMNLLKNVQSIANVKMLLKCPVFKNYVTFQNLYLTFMVRVRWSVCGALAFFCIVTFRSLTTIERRKRPLPGCYYRYDFVWDIGQSNLFFWTHRALDTRIVELSGSLCFCPTSKLHEAVVNTSIVLMRPMDGSTAAHAHVKVRTLKLLYILFYSLTLAGVCARFVNFFPIGNNYCPPMCTSIGSRTDEVYCVLVSNRVSRGCLHPCPLEKCIIFFFFIYCWT